MDCRWTHWFVAVLLAGAGCDAKTLPLSQAGPNSSAVPLPPGEVNPTKIASGDASSHEVKEVKPATLVALGDLKLRTAGQTPAEEQGNRDEARRAYQRALEADPKHVPAHLGLARLYELQNDHSRALTSYHTALKLAPDQPRIWFEIGMCHARHKEWKPALEHLRKAHDLDAANPIFSKRLGLCLARAGYPEEALLVLIRVEGEAPAHYTVARMMYQTHRDDQCKKYARLALVADPKLEGARQLLAELEGGAPPANIGASVFEQEQN
jgi:tetratricopeptide (TPR) repeat protein